MLIINFCKISFRAVCIFLENSPAVWGAEVKRIATASGGQNVAWPASSAYCSPETNRPLCPMNPTLEKLRRIRSQMPWTSSEEAYAQMERNREIVANRFVRKRSVGRETPVQANPKIAPLE